MRTLLIVCALATTLAGCSSQQSTQPSCVGLNPFACLTAVHVPIEAESRDSAWVDEAPRAVGVGMRALLK